MRKEKNTNNKMQFFIGDEIFVDSKDKNNDFYLTKDKSLLYTKNSGDYSVLLGGNWRFELIVDSSTGLCIKFQSFLDELKVFRRPLILPDVIHNNIYFTNEEMLFPGGGCHYFPFENMAYWDSEKNILCVGTPNIIGEAVEFTEKTIAVIKTGKLMCIYLVLDRVANIIDL